jgi:hypothetical protein
VFSLVDMIKNIVVVCCDLFRKIQDFRRMTNSTGVCFLGLAGVCFVVVGALCLLEVRRHGREQNKNTGLSTSEVRKYVFFICL